MNTHPETHMVWLAVLIFAAHLCYAESGARQAFQVENRIHALVADAVGPNLHPTGR